MEKRWVPRNYRPGDEIGILKLREKIWGNLEKEKLSPEFWKWQFMDNPAGKGFIQIADDTGTIVGHQPVVPTDFLIQGKRVKLAMSVDTMTHPGYQKQGIFTTLSTAVYEQAEKSSIDIIWGFPNENSRPGFIKNLEWSDVATLPVYASILRTENLLRQYLAFPRLNRMVATFLDPLSRLFFSVKSITTPSLAITEIYAFDERFDRLWNQNGYQHPIIQIRDAKYLQWRYFQIPLRKYRVFIAEQEGQPVCYMVLRSMDLFDIRAGVVVDLFPIHAERKAQMALFRRAIQIYLEEGRDLVVFMVPPQFAETATDAKFTRIPDFLNLKQWYVGLRYPGSRYSKAFLLNINNWYITFGDTDII
jgi:GNAT superfamily N-acetyltransferase